MAKHENPMVGDEHDDGLWPDFDLATESVRTESTARASARDTVVEQPEKKAPAKEKAPA